MNLTNEEQELLKKLMQNPGIVTLLNKNKTYNCTNCNHSFITDKNKRKCPKCSKFKLQEVSTTVKQEEITVSEPSHQEDSNFTYNPKANQAKAENQEEGRRCRRESIGSIQTQFVDTGQFKEDTERFTKKVKFSVTERRKPHKFIDVSCAQCQKTFNVNQSFYRQGWRCDNCVRIGR